MAVLALLAALLPSVPAPAAQNPSGISVATAQQFYAYVDAGENLDVTFTKNNAGGGNVTITVNGPGGVTQTCTNLGTAPSGSPCALTDLSSSQPGIWRIDYAGANAHTWTINVQDGTTTVPGRVWSQLIRASQGPTTPLLELWYQSKEGYRYKGSYTDYNGISSDISADATGVALKDTCVSAYESMDTTGTYSDTDRLWRPPPGQCGDPYKIFFEAPDADLPATANRWDGTSTWIARPRLRRISRTSGSRPTATASRAVPSRSTWPTSPGN